MACVAGSGNEGDNPNELVVVDDVVLEVGGGEAGEVGPLLVLLNGRSGTVRLLHMTETVAIGVTMSVGEVVTVVLTMAETVMTEVGIRVGTGEGRVSRLAIAVVVALGGLSDRGGQSQS